MVYHKRLESPSHAEPKQIVESFGESVNRRIFTGKEEDKATGLVYFGQRYYDADTARFITEDSYLGDQGEPPSLHRYLYAYSNPTVYIDLEGYLSWKDFVINPAGASLELASKGLAYLGEKVDQYVDKNAPGAVMTGVATIAKTGITVTKGIVDMPHDVAEQTVEYVKDPTNLAKLPILGQVGTNLGVSAARFAEDQSFENGVQLFGAVSGAFLTVEGGAAIPKGVNAVRGAVKTAVDSPTGAGLLRIFKDETGAVGPDIGDLIARNRSRGAAVADTAAADVVPKTTPVGELRAQGLKDAHHVIQDAAVRELPGYSTQQAPGVQLPGPSTSAEHLTTLLPKFSVKRGAEPMLQRDASVTRR